MTPFSNTSLPSQRNAGGSVCGISSPTRPGIRHYSDHDFPNSPFAENVWPVHSLREEIAFFKRDPPLFKPGTFYLYSSNAVNLLQGVIKSASGDGFEAYMREHVWEPAGMLSTAFDVPTITKVAKTT